MHTRILFYLLFFMLVVAHPTSAQQNLFTKTNLAITENTIRKEIVGETPEAVFVYFKEMGGMKLTLLRLDKSDNTMLTRADFKSVKSGKEKCFPVTFFILQNQLYALYISTSAKQNKHTYYSCRLSSLTLKPEEQPVKLFDYSYVTMSDRYAANEFIRTMVSANGRHAVIQIPAPMMDGTGSVHMYFFSAAMQRMGHAEVRQPLQQMELRQELVAHNGSFYYLFQQTQASDNEHTLPPFYIVKVNADGTYQQKKLALFDGHVVEARLAYNQNNTLHIAGYYSENATFSIRGAFCAAVDSVSTELSEVSTFPFTLEDREKALLEKQRGEYNKQKPDGPLEINNYYLKDVVFDRNDNLFILGEGYTQTRWVWYSPKTIRFGGANSFLLINTKQETDVTYTYTYGNILVSCITPNQAKVKNTVIPKKQTCDDAWKPLASFIAKPVSGGGIQILHNHFTRGEFTLVGNDVSNLRERNSMVYVITNVGADATIKQRWVLCDLTEKPVETETENYKCLKRVATDMFLPTNRDDVFLFFVEDQDLYGHWWR